MSSTVQTIISGLQPGNRLAYNKTAKQFEAISATKASEHDYNYVTQLSALEDHVEKFIKDNPQLTDPEISALKKAFETRAKIIEGKWWRIFTDRKAIGKELRGFKKIIDTAHAVKQTAQQIISPPAPQIVTPAPSPQPTTLSTQAQPPPTQISVTEKKEEALPAQKPPEIPEPIQKFEGEIPSGGPPPPPAGGPPPPTARKKFPGEPEPLKFSHTQYKNKNVSQLQDEIKQIEEYVPKLEKIRDELDEKMKLNEEMKSQKSAIQKDYIDPANAKLAILPAKIEDIVKMINGSPGDEFELQVDEGAMPVYTRVAFEQEEQKRAALNPGDKKVLNSSDPLANINALDHLLLVAYKEYKSAEETAGKKGETYLELLDAKQKPISPEEKNKEVVTRPLSLRNTVRQLSGTDQKSIEDLEAKIKEIETSKLGEVGFEEFKGRRDELNNQINIWNRAVQNRRQQIDKLQKGIVEEVKIEEKKESASIIEREPAYATKADKWNKIGMGERNKLGLSPDSTILTWLLRGRFQPRK